MSTSDGSLPGLCATVRSRFASKPVSRSRHITSARRSARCTRQNAPPVRHRNAAARQTSSSVHSTSPRAAALSAFGLSLPLPAAKYGGFDTMRSNCPVLNSSRQRRISPTTILQRSSSAFAAMFSRATRAASGFSSSPVMCSAVLLVRSSSGSMPEPQPRSMPLRRAPIFTKSASSTESVPSRKCSDCSNCGPSFHNSIFSVAL